VYKKSEGALHHAQSQISNLHERTNVSLIVGRWLRWSASANERMSEAWCCCCCLASFIIAASRRGCAPQWTGKVSGTKTSENCFSAVYYRAWFGWWWWCERYSCCRSQWHCLSAHSIVQHTSYLDHSLSAPNSFYSGFHSSLCEASCIRLRCLPTWLHIVVIVVVYLYIFVSS